MTFKQKYVRALPVTEMAGWRVKPYHVTRESDGVLADEIVDAAYATAAKLLPAPDGETPPAAWIVLHEGKSATYLCVYSWVWGNCVHARNAAAGEPYVGCPDGDLTNFHVLTEPMIGCVWELPTMAHERTAWVKHMIAPEVPDLAGYLADTMPRGSIG
jgi:hypothetical protein